MQHATRTPLNLASLAAALTAALAPLGMPHAADVEVIHWWTSGGEQAAVSVFADEFDALGEDRWIDTAIAGGDQARAATMQRILGGDAPQAAQFNISRQFEELIEAGLLLDLTELADAEGWREKIRPASILEPCIKDERIYCVPVNIHSWQWAWASPKVFADAGVPLPATIPEFLDAAPKIQAAGFIPFAIGGQTWQYNGAFNVMLLNHVGRDLYHRIYRDKDGAAAKSGAIREVFANFKQLKQFADDGHANRSWNDTTNLIITHKAALQIMGDWARGEFALAGKTAGEDYECIPGPSKTPYLSTGGDVFIFPKADDEAVRAAQLKMASMMLSPRVQALFNLAKGSLPVRDDVDLSLADSCMKKGLALLANPETIVGDPINFVTADTDGELRDLFAEFWSDDAMTVETAQARFAQIITAAE